MEIFFRLLFAHLLADFTFQTNYIARWKRESVWGLLTHVALHPICYAVVLWPFRGQTWACPLGFNSSPFLAILISSVVHLVEDWFRVGRVKKGWRDNTAFYAWDQAVHIASLWLLSPVKTQPATSLWPLLGALAVIVTHFSTVTLWFLEKDFSGRDYPETEEKYVLILQRFAVWVAFFLPAPFWLLVPAAIIAAFMRHVWVRRVDYTWFSVIGGNLISVACGLYARFGLAVSF